MVHLVWIGGTGVLQSILSSLILKVYHAFAFKPITIKFGEFTNFWMLFQMTCSIFNSIDIECSHTEKICSYPVPCSFRTWPIDRHIITVLRHWTVKTPTVFTTNHFVAFGFTNNPNVPSNVNTAYGFHLLQFVTATRWKERDKNTLD